jgi:DNA invertase Pin-like site-specific DNA recombinase
MMHVFSSTDGQTLDAQRAELKRAKAVKIFAETESGARRDRPQLNRVLKQLQRGDVLIVSRLDRLARSTRDLLNIVKQIDDAGARLKSLHDAWADSTTAHGRLMMTVLAGLAEFERELITARTSEGRKRAKHSGIKFGPKFKLNKFQRVEAMQRKNAGEPLAAIGRTYGVSKSTISRLARTANV